MDQGGKLKGWDQRDFSDKKTIPEIPEFKKSLKLKHIAQLRKRGFSMLLFPLPFAGNKENGNIESRIRTMKPVYILPAARK